jgi:deoxyuridine 5'-triphosphate nucleotidohydrolase
MKEITPEFKFALTQTVQQHCPSELEHKPLLATDFLPKANKNTDTGYDVRCAEPEGIEICPDEYFKIRLGFRMFAPEGWWMQLVPRSSTFIKQGIHALYGVIDETYENEMMFCGQFVPDSKVLIPGGDKNCFRIEFGQRIAQLIPVERQTMLCTEVTNDEFDHLCRERNAPRGIGGFGSSGKY